MFDPHATRAVQEMAKRPKKKKKEIHMVDCDQQLGITEKWHISEGIQGMRYKYYFVMHEFFSRMVENRGAIKSRHAGPGETGFKS